MFSKSISFFIQSIIKNINLLIACTHESTFVDHILKLNSGASLLQRFNTDFVTVAESTYVLLGDALNETNKEKLCMIIEKKTNVLDTLKSIPVNVDLHDTISALLLMVTALPHAK